jgi:hypothetical protein
MAWESLESRALLATLFPGNPINVGAPVTFSGVGGTNTAGQALDQLHAFETAIGGTKNTLAAPQATGFRVINWDGVKLDGTDFGGGANTIVINAGKSVAIPLNRFQTLGTFFQEVYIVSGDGFTDVNPNVAGLFPAFSPSNTFAMSNDNGIDQSFVLPSAAGTNPGLAATRGFGAIFINNQTTTINGNQVDPSSIEYFHGAESLGRFPVPTGNPGEAEFLGVLFSSPIVTKVTLTLGTDVLFNFDGSTASGTSTDNPAGGHNLVVTDDFVYAEPVSIPDAVPILPGPNGTLNAVPKASATVATAFNGVVATFSDSDPTAKASQFTATINWGDGHTSNGVVQQNAQGGFDVVGTNTFGIAGLIPTSVHIQDFTGSPELDVANVMQVAAAATTTTLAVAPNPAAIAGQAVTLTAHVTPSAGGTANNGTVLFEDNGLPLGIGAVDSSGNASFTTTTLSLGTHSLTAVFLGTPAFTTSTSAAVSETVRADVTNQIVVTFGAVTRRGRRVIRHITLQNLGTTLSGPLAFVLDGLPSKIKVVNASGVTMTVAPFGSPFIFLTLDPSNQLASGASVSLDVILKGKSARTARFTPRILAGLTQP